MIIHVDGGSDGKGGVRGSRDSYPSPTALKNTGPVLRYYYAHLHFHMPLPYEKILNLTTTRISLVRHS